MPADPFPNRTEANCHVKSPATYEYNCVGWAVHTKRHYIWPDEREQLAWPPDMPREETVDALRGFFERIGFSRCPDADFEARYEKVAIYATAGNPQHVARQRRSGRWTSKLGGQVDVDHATLGVLAGGPYGEVVLIMRRLWDGKPPTLPPLHPPPSALIRSDGRPLLP